MKKNIFLLLILCGVIGLNFKFNFRVNAATGHCYTSDEKYKSEWSDEKSSGSYQLNQADIDAGYTIAAVWIKASTECFKYTPSTSSSVCYSVSWNDDQTSVKVDENFVEDDGSGCHDVSHFEIQLSDPNPVPTPTNTPTPTPDPGDDPSPTPTNTPTPTPEISQAVSPTNTPVPTNTPAPTSTPVPTPEPTDEPEDEDEETETQEDSSDDNNDNEESTSESQTEEETETPQRSQILGASTDGYAATGVATDIVMSFAGISGAGLTGLGFALDKKSKK